MIEFLETIFGFRRASNDVYEQPLLGEIFSVERLEQYARTLAAEHKTVTKRGRAQLLPRLEENSRKLVAAYRSLVEAIRNGRTISPAAEWLVDNFHIVEEQLREIRQDLPRSYYHELPKLAEGEFKGYPRIYALALALISHTDCRLDTNTLRRFIAAYQTIAPLSIGELWAVAITLRLALVENLRRLATIIVNGREEREQADKLADKLLELAARQPAALIPLISDRVGKRERIPQTFVVQLTQRLREQDPAVMPVTDYLEKQLHRQGLSVEQTIHAEHQRQAATHSTIGNIISSMRLLSTLDWQVFFESVSLVEPVLERDPAGVYSQMDFGTRNCYRNVIERIARRTNSNELDVARRVVELSQAASQVEPQHDYKAHVGFYLIDAGLADLECAFAYRPDPVEYFRRTVLRHPKLFYMGDLVILMTAFVGGLATYTWRAGSSPMFALIAMLLTLAPSAALAIRVLDWIMTPRLVTNPLPRIGTFKDISANARTIVVISTLFTDEETVRTLFEKLEVHYLANQSEHIYFALLGDFNDAPAKEMPNDSVLLDAARKALDDLNNRYPHEPYSRFHLFHRDRQWNAGEEKWIGWERKRGKLREFNRLLRGARDTSFVSDTVDQGFLSEIRYVIALDSDTTLPREAARELVGIISHPLNRAEWDPHTGCLVRGYGIFQPRISFSWVSSTGTKFARIFSGNEKIDPYSSAASDLYYNLFGDGNYTGKGLYDVDAFEAALGSHLPENCFLSHDLFESLLVRTALVANLQFQDDYPAHYVSYARRQHRWTRGDWQIARWLFRNVPDDEGCKKRNHLPLLARWKILDTLIRSLVSPSVVVWLTLSWTVLPGSAELSTIFVLLMLVFQTSTHKPMATVPRRMSLADLFGYGLVRTRITAWQVVLMIAFLPHQAYLMLDAIVRTLYRKLWSHCHLLEWPANQEEKESVQSLGSVVRFMWPGEVISLVITVLVLLIKPEMTIVATPFLLLWLASPLLAHWTGRPISANTNDVLTQKETRVARLIARRTWAFFEICLGAKTNWLPPDHYYEDPITFVTNRTSPSTIGLYLLSTIAAHDLGYISIVQLTERIQLTLTTLDKLPRFHGHYFKAYDTRTMLPISPSEISTAESGNLAGHLIAFKQACIEKMSCPLFETRASLGFADTITLTTEAITRLPVLEERSQIPTIKQLIEGLETCLREISREKPETLIECSAVFRSVCEHTESLSEIVNTLSREYGTKTFEETRFWITALHSQAHAHRSSIAGLLLWENEITPSLTDAISRCDDEIREEWQEILYQLKSLRSLSKMPAMCEAICAQLANVSEKLKVLESHDSLDYTVAVNGLGTLTTAVKEASHAACILLTQLRHFVNFSVAVIGGIDFGFLLDGELQIFTTGYDVSELRHDNSFYDLLASNARLTSFVAIAKGEIPQEHWFRMRRQLTSVDGGRALISWSGTMSEYLMPLLVMRNYGGTLLDETYRTVVNRQIEYGQERGVAWGISEAGYNVRDLQLNYEFDRFGVPGLGLKRGLVEELVIAPYATMLAAMITPRAAIANLQRLEGEGALTRYGFYEALDYTAKRLPTNQKHALINAFSTSHQGAGLIALDNLVNANVMQRRFHADPSVQATELLLQERIPVGVPASHPRAEEVLTGRVAQGLPGMFTRVYHRIDTETPRTQLLSNGTYNVMVTAAGGGYSNCGANAVTRWREDVTRDNWGGFIYLRDVRSGAVWSASYQPILKRPQSYEVAFSEDKADFWRSDSGITTHMEILVSAEDNAEVRRVSLTNNSQRTREIELTSYAEVVLNTPQADAAHPAFGNLFIETEFFAAENAILAHRRQRSSVDEQLWGVHGVAVEGDLVGGVQYETDRGRFLGRGHTPSDPVAVMEDRPLSNTTGAILDPVFSLRRRVRIPPNQTVRCSFSTGQARSREEAMRLAHKYHDPNTFERELRLAWTKAQVEMSHLKIDAEEAHLFQRLASRIIYSEPSMRPRPHVLGLNTKTQSSLWAYGLSGELPILVVRIDKAEDLPIVRKIMRGHEYLRYKGLKIDLVILNDNPTTNLQLLHKDLDAMIRAGRLGSSQDKPGGAFLRHTDQMPEEDRILLHSVARVVIVTERGLLEDQLERPFVEERLPATFTPRSPARTYPEPTLAPPELTFFNGLGGFHQGGREYVTLLGAEQWTPAPWSNIIANKNEFGFQVTETGTGATWSINSRENRLTPWSNDAVSDPPGEIVYLRDEDTGTVWSATPLPIRQTEPYTIRHGQGYSVFEQTSHGISQELLLFAPLEDPVKISVFRLRNRTDRKRKLTVTLYNELVLGVQRAISAPYVITEIDHEASTIFARNPFNNEFASRVAFCATNERVSSATCDRKEFLGRNGTLASPAALRRVNLAGRDGAGIDPCAALQITVELAPYEVREVIFMLGEAESKAAAQSVVAKFINPGGVNNAFEQVLLHWDSLLGAIEVRTPDGAFDIMLNRWLLYQTLSCRIWARSGFYESGGSLGFRDELQDVMALVYSNPAIARKQILKSSTHHFKEGDAQDWGPPLAGRVVRTHFSDDLLWLPFVAAFYINVTGDLSVLDEVVPALQESPLKTDEHEDHVQPEVSPASGSVFDACVLALDRGLLVGTHGLPLMGDGDWNDGLNRVGHLGKGESVWVGWFLYATLAAFSPLCDQRKLPERANSYRKHCEHLKTALAENAWDGDWYRRAYFDDGTPLGSVQNDECRIDSIVQSWSVISGAAETYRSQRAMAAVEEYLVRRGDGLVILFTPPFDKSNLDPGYVKGYVPGVRENGGQNTQAALWILIAFALLGDGERASELFSLLNPVQHSSTRAGLHKYKVEPYVAAGDVYAVPPHMGRGGWTWYTGSAAWMYRAGLESILGFKLQGQRLMVDPCVPRWWRDFEITYRRGRTVYRIKMENPLAVTRGVAMVELDGTLQPNDEIPLTDDNETHNVRVVMGEKDKS